MQVLCSCHLKPSYPTINTGRKLVCVHAHLTEWVCGPVLHILTTDKWVLVVMRLTDLSQARLQGRGGAACLILTHDVSHHYWKLLKAHIKRPHLNPLDKPQNSYKTGKHEKQNWFHKKSYRIVNSRLQKNPKNSSQGKRLRTETWKKWWTVCRIFLLHWVLHC